jgi:hypothetical protein
MDEFNNRIMPCEMNTGHSLTSELNNSSAPWPLDFGEETSKSVNSVLCSQSAEVVAYLLPKLRHRAHFMLTSKLIK